MPFKSEKQRRFLWAAHPDIAKRWAKEYPESNKGLPMYAKDKKDDETVKKAEVFAVLRNVLGKNSTNLFSRILTNENTGKMKAANSKMEHVVMPSDAKPTYAGENNIEKKPKPETEDEGSIGDARNVNATVKSPCMPETPLVNKLAAVLAPRIQQMIEDQKAQQEARHAVRVPRTANVKRYPTPSATIPPPIGMAQPPGQPPAPAQPQQPQQPQPAQAQAAPQNGLPSVSGQGGSPQANPINSFGGISMKGEFNGNASLGTANAPGAKMAAQKCSCGCGDTTKTCKCPPSCSCRQKGGSCYGLKLEKKAGGNNEWLQSIMSIDRNPIIDPEEYDDDYEKSSGSPAWQRSAGKNPEGGLNAKGRASYNRATGGNLKAPVTESNPKGERASRQNSFCSRMCGMKSKETGADTAKDPDSRINKSLRKWNCKCSAVEFGQKVAQEFDPALSRDAENAVMHGTGLVGSGLLGTLAGVPVSAGLESLAQKYNVIPDAEKHWLGNAAVNGLIRAPVIAGGMLGMRLYDNYILRPHMRRELAAKQEEEAIRQKLQEEATFKKKAEATLGRVLGTALVSTGGGLALGSYPGWKLQRASEEAGNSDYVNFVAGKAPIALGGAVSGALFNHWLDSMDKKKKQEKPKPANLATYLQYMVH